MACQLDQYQDKADEDRGGCDKETHQVEGYGSGVLRGKHCGSRGIIPASRPFLAVGTSRDRSLSCMAAYSGCLCCYLLSERLCLNLVDRQTHSLHQAKFQELAQSGDHRWPADPTSKPAGLMLIPVVSARENRAPFVPDDLL